jgi:hypothetical protein
MTAAVWSCPLAIGYAILSLLFGVVFVWGSHVYRTVLQRSSSLDNGQLIFILLMLAQSVSRVCYFAFSVDRIPADTCANPAADCSLWGAFTTAPTYVFVTAFSILCHTYCHAYHISTNEQSRGGRIAYRCVFWGLIAMNVSLYAVGIHQYVDMWLHSTSACSGLMSTAIGLLSSYTLLIGLLFAVYCVLLHRRFVSLLALADTRYFPLFVPLLIHLATFQKFPQDQSNMFLVHYSHVIPPAMNICM